MKGHTAFLLKILKLKTVLFAVYYLRKRFFIIFATHYSEINFLWNR